MENRQLNWLLVAYMRPDARVGVAADRETARAALVALRKRASYLAMLRGIRDSQLAEDALSAMLEWVATSRISERFRLARGTPHRFINGILARFVQQEITKRWRRSNFPLPEGVPASTIDPATEVEMKDLRDACRARLGIDAVGTFAKGSPDDSAGARYLRKHRERQRQWDRVADLFPDRRLRPPKRRFR